MTDDGDSADPAGAAELFAELSADYLGRTGVQARRMWGSHGLTVNGKTFATMRAARLAVKVPARRAAEYVAGGDAEPFAPRPDRPLKEWVAFAFDSAAPAAWSDALAQAFRYVATLTGSTQQPVAEIDDPGEISARVSEAFGLGRASGVMEPNARTSQETWRLRTSEGAFLVKRFWRGPDLPWQPSLQRAMAFEAAAVKAGIDTVEPVSPVMPVFGFAASIEGLGIFRAYPYVEHRPLGPDEDVVEWAAATLARIQNLQSPLRKLPEPTWFYNQFPATPPQLWEQWAERAADAGRVWSASLTERLPLLHALSRRVVEAFDATPPHVMTHRDVEPWNVLMVPTAAGHRPLLVDWDVAGPDSAVLEAAHVVTSFAGSATTPTQTGTVDAAAARRGAAAYQAAGGQPFDPHTDLLARRLGMRLARLSGRLRSNLDNATAGSLGDGAPSDSAITGYLDGLPAYVTTAERDAAELIA